jgi:CRISPR-associated protein Csb2
MYLRVFFPSGKYYAAENYDPTRPEWPPHPSRVFSAMVASAYHVDNGMSEKMRRAFEWLEAQPPPSIAAPVADLSQAPLTYVPPGDLDKREEKKAHPVHRMKQPRYFPRAVIMGDPVVYYDWKEDPPENIVCSLEKIAAGVTHIGTSHSMATVNIFRGEMPQRASYILDKEGSCFLRVALPGRLEELDKIFLQEAGIRRPPSLCETLASYRLVRDTTGNIQQSWIDFFPMHITGTLHGADTAAYLGRAVRRAVMSVLGDDAPPAVHGHSGEDHVGWLPLPDVGHKHANGRIVGVGIFLPKALMTEHRQKIFKGINLVRNLRLPDGRIANLFPPNPGERLPIALSPKVWTRPSSLWASVTPVVLDRPPKKLSQNRIQDALMESLIFAGYPKPKKIEVSAFSRFSGAPPAFRVVADKPRYHATVHFEEPVQGPVIAGRLRYFGIGLFRPLLSSDNQEDPQ